MVNKFLMSAHFRWLRETCRRLGAGWMSVAPLLRAAATTMWVLGAVCFLLGVLGDAQDWWDDRPFLTNLASGLTSVLFGVPFGLIVLAKLAAHQNQADDLATLRNQTTLRVRDIRDSLSQVFATGQCPNIGVLIMRLDEQPVFGEVKAALYKIEPERRAHSGRTMAISCADVARVLELWDKSYSCDDSKLLASLGKVWDAWRFLHDHVAPRRVEFGLAWIPGDASRAIDAGLARAMHVRPNAAINFLRRELDKHDPCAMPGTTTVDSQRLRNATDVLIKYVSDLHNVAKEVPWLYAAAYEEPVTGQPFNFEG